MDISKEKLEVLRWWGQKYVDEYIVPKEKVYKEEDEEDDINRHIYTPEKQQQIIEKRLARDEVNEVAVLEDVKKRPCLPAYIRDHFRNILVYEECWSWWELDKHHINKNPRDNRIENIVKLCIECHKSKHIWESAYNIIGKWNRNYFAKRTKVDKSSATHTR